MSSFDSRYQNISLFSFSQKFCGGDKMAFRVKFRLRLVGCKIFSECKIFSNENIFRKGKYFQVFGCIPKNALENIF